MLEPAKQRLSIFNLTFKMEFYVNHYFSLSGKHSCTYMKIIHFFQHQIPIGTVTIWCDTNLIAYMLSIEVSGRIFSKPLVLEKCAMIMPTVREFTKKSLKSNFCVIFKNGWFISEVPYFPADAANICVNRNEMIF